MESIENILGDSIVKIIKAQRLQWYAHIKSTLDHNNRSEIADKLRGRPRSRWGDQEFGDMQK